MLQAQHAFGGHQNFSHDHQLWLNQQQQQQAQQAQQVQQQQHLSRQQQQQPQHTASAQSQSASLAQQGMYNLPPNGRSAGTVTMHNNNGPTPNPNALQHVAAQRLTDEETKVYGWIMELMHGSSREQALLELSKKREQVDDLALLLWHAFGRLIMRDRIRLQCFFPITAY